MKKKITIYSKFLDFSRKLLLFRALLLGFVSVRAFVSEYLCNALWIEVTHPAPAPPLRGAGSA